jgi:hypothetical protein
MLDPRIARAAKTFLSSLDGGGRQIVSGADSTAGSERIVLGSGNQNDLNERNNRNRNRSL